LYNGVPAALIFLLLCFFTLRIAFKNLDLWGGYLLCSLIGLLTDGIQMINNPNELWMLVLLPMSLIIKNCGANTELS